MTEPFTEKWATGKMLCLACGFDRGIHVWFVGSEPVECPRCTEMMCVPKDGAGFGDIPFGEPRGEPR